MHYFSKTFLLMVFITIFKLAAFSQDRLSLSSSMTEKLNYPYGTILTLQVEIFDGDQLKDLLHYGFFLFKIKAINDTTLAHPILMEFRDRTYLDSALLPSNIIQLYDYIYGEDSSLNARSNQNTRLIKSKYVGREFIVKGYESGQFVGEPADVMDYQPASPTPFHFKHFIVVVAKQFENDWHILKGSLKK